MKCFCLLNHSLTDSQIAELKNEWHCDEIIYPNEELSYAWSHIPATKEMDTKVFKLIGDWWQENGYPNIKGDLILTQGESGTNYALVQWAKIVKLIPIYAVSDRKSKDEKMEDGTTKKVSYFEHVCFREYLDYGEVRIKKLLDSYNKPNEDSKKMRRVFIIRKDLHLSSGKLAAMVAHCAEAYWTRLISSKVIHTYRFDTENQELKPTKDYSAALDLDGDIVDNYVNASFTKTICEARNLNQLMKAETIAKEMGLVENVDYGFIDDNCLTELTPEFVGEDGKQHCRVGMWFKPLEDEDAHKISKKFPLYKD